MTRDVVDARRALDGTGAVADPTASGLGCAAVVSPDGHDDHQVLTVRGALSSAREEDALRHVLRAQLLDRGRVVVDLCAAAVPSGSAARLFPTALAEVGGWPLGRLVLARAKPHSAGILRAARVHLTVPIAATLPAARVLLDARPPRVSRAHELPCTSAAPLLARIAVASACDDWEVDDALHDAAATVATELVRNAVDHAVEHPALPDRGPALDRDRRSE